MKHAVVLLMCDCLQLNNAIILIKFSVTMSGTFLHRYMDLHVLSILGLFASTSYCTQKDTVNVAEDLINIIYTIRPDRLLAQVL